MILDNIIPVVVRLWYGYGTVMGYFRRKKRTLIQLIPTIILLSQYQLFLHQIRLSGQSFLVCLIEYFNKYYHKQQNLNI
jgi:hypothetical protein